MNYCIAFVAKWPNAKYLENEIVIVKKIAKNSFFVIFDEKKDARGK